MTENSEIVKTELEATEILNNFFGNAIKNLMIPKYSEIDTSIDRVENRTIRVILKYRNRPSILAIHEQKKTQINFILNLYNKKASQNSDIPTKIIKKNSDIFGKVLWSFINDSIKSFTFPPCLKEAYATLIHKKVRKIRKKTIGQSTFY